jgi:hypothetical protein
MPRENTILFEDARIIFRNFAGKEGKFNREGDRNFCVLLDNDLATQLDTDGWNVKALKAREEGDPDQPYMQVSVSFKGRPPKVVMITSRGRTDLTEDEIDLLDWADILQVDLIIRPYTWEVGGKGGIKAYLKSIFVTIEEDALDLKYADVEEIPSRSGRVTE